MSKMQTGLDPVVDDDGESGRTPATTLLDVVIVVSTGDRRHIEPCLRSLAENGPSRGRMAVHVVDNASSDGTADVVEERYPWVRLERLGWNAGFCIANNVVLARSTAEYVLVLNPDTEVRPGTLDHLIEFMDSRPDVGMVGCRLVLRDGSFDHAAKRSFPTPLSAIAHFTGFGRKDGASARLAQYRAPQVDEFGAGEVDAVNGAFMLVRRRAIEDVGFFDEAYWLYMEDLDWCYRFKQAGWKVWYDGSVSVLHIKGGATVKRGHRRLRQNYAFHRGMYRFYRKFYGGRRPLLDVAVYAGIALKFGISASRGALALLTAGRRPAPGTTAAETPSTRGPEGRTPRARDRVG